MENNTRDMLKFVRISCEATVPTKGTPGSAGYDLYASSNTVIAPRGNGCVPTDLVIAVPTGTYGRIAPRSGLAVHKCIDVGAGVVDSDYRGPIGVVLFNHGDLPFMVQVGDRIAQLICEKIVYPQLKEVDYLENTKRGKKGFGSTGKK